MCMYVCMYITLTTDVYFRKLNYHSFVYVCVALLNRSIYSIVEKCGDASPKAHSRLKVMANKTTTHVKRHRQHEDPFSQSINTSPRVNVKITVSG